MTNKQKGKRWTRSSGALKIIAALYLILIYLFIFVPMIIVVVGSFNSQRSFPAAFESITFQWYVNLLHHSRFLNSALTSVIVAVMATIVAVLLGVPLSLFIARARIPGMRYVNAFVMLPLLIPQIAVSIALLQTFQIAKIKLSIFTLIVAHSVFVMPYVIRAVVSVLQMLDENIEEAALCLGANRFKTFFRITLPLMWGGITAGSLLAFIMSFVNVPLSFFLSTPRISTLPIAVFAYMKERLDPLVAAIGALTFIIAIIVSILLEKVFKVRLIV